MKTPEEEKKKKNKTPNTSIILWLSVQEVWLVVDDTAKSRKRSARSLMKVGPEIGAAIRTGEPFCRHRGPQTQISIDSQDTSFKDRSAALVERKQKKKKKNHPQLCLW